MDLDAEKPTKTLHTPQYRGTHCVYVYAHTCMHLSVCLSEEKGVPAWANSKELLVWESGGGG